MFFPGVDGCTSGGDTLEEAFRNAIEGLQFHIDGLREDGLDVPPPRAVIEWPVWAGRRPKGVVGAFIPVEVSASATRINITIDPGLLARIDRAAEAEGMTRSGFLAHAARERLAERHRGTSKRPASKRPKAA